MRDRIRKHQRMAISPIIATVLIVAVTLVAAVAVGGFVFGLFGSSSNTAQVQVVSAFAKASMTGGATASSITAACAAAAGANSYVQLSNTGSVGTTVSTLFITYAGVTYSVAPTGACTSTPGTPLYVQISAFTYAAGAAALASGTQYTGYVVTTNGAQVVFSGAFQ